MKTYEQLMAYYWGVIVPMAEAAGIDPWLCVRTDGVIFKDHPKFILKYQEYTFAITVLEGKPVFIGDKLYSVITGQGYTVSDLSTSCMMKNYTWTPPTKKRTFIVELDESQINRIIARYGCMDVDDDLYTLFLKTRSNQNAM